MSGLPTPDERKLISAEDRIDRHQFGVIRRARGKALRRTDPQIAALAKVTPADIQASRDDWKRKTLPEYRNLIDADRED